MFKSLSGVVRGSCIAQRAASQSAVAAKPDATPGLYTLGNGLRVAADVRPGAETCSVALTVEAGTRHESTANNGVSNLITRLAGKGTSTRKQSDLENEVAKLGGDIQISTSRETTTFAFNGFAKDAPKAVELLADLVKNAVYDENQLNVERERVLDELKQVLENDPEAVTMDYLYSVAFQGTPLALSRQGSTANVKRLTRNDILSFIDNNYKAPRMTLTSSGGVNGETLATAADKSLADVGTKYPGEITMTKPCRYTGSEVQHRDDALPIAYTALSVESCGMFDSAAVPLNIFNAIVGAGDKSCLGGEHDTRTPLAHVAGREGFYGYKSFNHMYSNQGLFGVLFMATPNELINAGLFFPSFWLKYAGTVTDGALKFGQNRLRTQLLTDSFNQAKSAERLANQILFRGSLTSLEEDLAEISATKREAVQQTLYDYFFDQNLTRAAYGPTEATLEYLISQGKMSPFRW